MAPYYKYVQDRDVLTRLVFLVCKSMEVETRAPIGGSKGGIHPGLMANQ